MTDLIETVVSLALKRCDGAGDVERFVQTYLGRVHPDDVLGRAPEDVCGAAVSLFRLVRRRTPGQPNVRVYNPDWEQHGWRSPHTVIEIVTDDMPFLIESLIMLLNRHEVDLHVSIHPIGRVRRGKDGELEVIEDAEQRSQLESWIHFEIDRIKEPSRLDALAAELRAVLGDVSSVVEDWRDMRERATATSATLRAEPPPLEPAEVQEGAEFLDWLVDDHFTFLGSRDYTLTRKDGTDVLASVPGTGLGILREPRTAPTRHRLSAAASRVARERDLLVLTKTNAGSTVHRPGRMAYVGVKLFDSQGEVVGERRFLGLWGRRAYTVGWQDIPLLRGRLRAALAEVAYPQGSHNERELIELLDSTPRELAFQTSTRMIVKWCRLSADLLTRGRVRLFVFRETFGRFYNCSLYLPRDRYNATTRRRTEQILLRALAGTEIEHTATLGESSLARVHFIVWAPPDTHAALNIPELEAKLTEASRPWEEELRDALIEHAGEERGPRHHLRYRDAFPAAYREDFPVRSAVADIERMEGLRRGDELGIALYRPVSGPDGAIRFKILRAGPPMSLSDILPLLENLGVRVLDERPYQVTPRDGDPIWIYDLGLTLPGGTEIDREGFQEAFAKAWQGAIENDGLNRLVLLAGLGWRDVVVLRAICKYLRQAGTAFSQAYMDECLARNPQIAKHLAELFTARFSPGRPGRMIPLVEQLEAEIDAVESLDEDRILRRFLRTIQAMLRTNHFQAGSDGGPKPYLSFKVAPAMVPEMPLPLPEFEIFVYSPAVEGVHLRGGAIARGGLRWSDRKEDFRTEILGLMKAQNVKNTVIVPTGAKGGFVVKRPPSTPDRDALIAEGVECYQTFISGLLDITDNLVGGEVVPPPDVVRYDGDDAYLVVAADKGTATFSDIANALSLERGFWLGDAFASGGSAGYDHKKMGITALGAWESVKRHFRQLGIDTQREAFTVAGVGDMSGDVFGNGMLASEHIRLVAAFDHRHVFVDPNPDPATGFAERQRLFALSRSSWADYDRTKISAGGGVFPRTAKSITISDEARAALGVDASQMAPNDLIKAILRAPVDLLWNGGIGTYVKATHQRHADVGDRANDAVRVDAADMRCRVIGEGGNLGLTQSARVEFALGGGLINTDAVDNSAGVDCSDHEVNIKILLDRVVADGDLTGKQRNELLAAMTDEVAELVLEDNREQTQALVNATTQAGSMREVLARYIRHLAQIGTLDRELEHLPSDQELAERAAAGNGLVAPEFAVLLAYTKLLLLNEILASDIPDEPYLGREVSAYFPGAIRARFPEQLQRHQLRREIIATRVANRIVNRAGTSFVFRMADETGESVCDVVRAHLAATDMFGATALWDRVLACEGQLTAQTQTALLLAVRKLVERGTRWLLRNAVLPVDLDVTVSSFEPGLRIMAERLPELLTGTAAAAHGSRVQALVDSGVPTDLAGAVAGFDDLFPGLDIVRAARLEGRPVEEFATAYFELGEALEIGWLRETINGLPRDDRWHAQARAALREDLYREHSTLTSDVLHGADPSTNEPPLDAWLRDRKLSVERYRSLLEDLRPSPAVDHAAVCVALRELRNVIQLRTPLARPAESVHHP